ILPYEKKSNVKRTFAKDEIQKAKQRAKEDGLEDCWEFFLPLKYPYISKTVFENSYFYPVCFSYFELENLDDIQARFHSMLGLAEKIITFAGQIALSVIIKHAGIKIKDHVPIEKKKIGFGTWISVLKTFIASDFQFKGVLSDFLHGFVRPANLSRMEKFKNLRNDYAHPHREIPKIIAEKEFENFITDLKMLLLDFGRLCVDWDLVIPEVSPGSSMIKLLKLRGAKEYDFEKEERPLENLHELQYNNMPCLLHYREGEIISLYPFVLWEECPHCFRNEIFIFIGFTHKGSTKYISFKDHILEFDLGNKVSRKVMSYLT
ncbi:MAG: hypothetical protein H5U39_09800, partial [Deferribacterales bacterium]|nr:hypothetical protein [Deferribacterales bacterium]